MVMIGQRGRAVTWLAALVALAFVGAGACSSSSSSNGYADAGPVTHPDVEVSPSSDAEVEEGGTCIPAPSVPAPTWVPPAAHQNACTQAELDSFAACLDSGDATSTACAGWLGAGGPTDATCFACVQAVPSTASTWGPLVKWGSITNVNVPGCVALQTGDPGGAGCAGALSASDDCELSACETNCEGVSNAALAACGTAADNGICAQYNAATYCLDEAGAAALSCFPTSPTSATFGQIFDIAAVPFCLAVDGGTPPGSDAGAAFDASIDSGEPGDSGDSGASDAAGE